MAKKSGKKTNYSRHGTKLEDRHHSKQMHGSDDGYHCDKTGPGDGYVKGDGDAHLKNVPGPSGKNVSNGGKGGY